VSLLPIGIVAIDHFRLLRMQFQPTLLQSCRYFDTHQVGFPLCSQGSEEMIRGFGLMPPPPIRWAIASRNGDLWLLR
jgi:hypothetical protein